MRRLFVDPGSKSCGVAVFEEHTLLTSTTLKPRGGTGSERVQDLFKLIEEFISLRFIDETHIEQFGGRPSYILHWAVGATIAACHDVPYVGQDIPVQSWMKFTGWKYDRKPLEPYEDSVSSEDELAAIGMGLFYCNKIMRETQEKLECLKQIQQDSLQLNSQKRSKRSKKRKRTSKAMRSERS